MNKLITISNYIFPLILLFLSLSCYSQVSVEFNSGGIAVEGTVRVFEGGTCSIFGMEGVEGQSYLSLTIDVVEGTDEIVEVILDGDDLDLEDFIEPTFGCGLHIFNVSGAVGSYKVVGLPQPIQEQVVSGNVNYTDIIKVYSPVSTTIELPIHVSASLVAVQTFCDPFDSEAFASAQITGSLGGETVSVGGEASISGVLLDTDYPDETKTIIVSVEQGINIFPFNLSGILYARSTVAGILPSGLLACGSNAGAIAGNSLTVRNFTGPNGGPLPEGMTIEGLITGINYVNPELGICDTIEVPQINTMDASCGQANGQANVLEGNIDPANIEWSNGSIGLSASGLGAGEHYVVFSDGSNCSEVLNFNIVDPTAPQTSLPLDTFILNNETIILDATGSDPTLIYNWSTGQTTSQISINSPGTYTLVVTDTSGCSYDYLVNVSLLNLCADPCSGCSTFNFIDFEDSESFTFLNAANITSENTIEITPSQNSQIGAFWFTQHKLLITDGFSTEFDFKISEGEGSQQGGADGFAFVIQNSEPEALGNSGFGIGYHGIQNGIAIEFDTYMNASGFPASAVDDFDGNHISIQAKNGNFIDAYQEYSLGMSSIPNDFIDGATHNVRINYDGDSLSIFFDYAVDPVIKIAIEFSEYIDDIEQGIWFGFTASTGYEKEKNEILNWSFSTDCIASCEDSIQNGNETGVDCGGDCLPCYNCFAINEDSVLINCLEDGAYTVKIPINGNGDFKNYQVFEQYNHYLEIDTISFVDDGTIDSIIVGPYPPGRDYRIIIEDQDESIECNFIFEGMSPCPISCEEMEVSYSYFCDPNSNEYYVVGNILNGTVPFSIVHDFDTIVILPDQNNSFEIGPFNNFSNGLYEVHITDFNNCYLKDTVLVEEDFIPIVDLGQDTFINENEDLTLNATPINGTNVSYLWSTGDTTSTIIISNGGTYYVYVTNTEGCTAIDEITVSIISAVEIVEEIGSFSVFPNPGDNKVTVRCNFVIQNGVEIEFLDITGKVVLKEFITEEEQVIKTSSLPSGVYFVLLKTKNNIGLKKWVKK